MNINRKVRILAEDDEVPIGKAIIRETFHQRGYQTRDRVPLAMGERDKFVIDCPELDAWVEEWGNLRFQIDDDAFLIPADYVEPDENDEYWVVEVTPLN